MIEELIILKTVLRYLEARLKLAINSDLCDGLVIYIQRERSGGSKQKDLNYCVNCSHLNTNPWSVRSLFFDPTYGARTFRKNHILKNASLEDKYSGYIIQLKKKKKLLKGERLPRSDKVKGQ